MPVTACNAFQCSMDNEGLMVSLHLSDVVEVAVRGGLLRQELLVRIQLLVQAELLLQQHEPVVAEGLGGAHCRDPQNPAASTLSVSLLQTDHTWGAKLAKTYTHIVGHNYSLKVPTCAVALLKPRHQLLGS